MYSKKKKTIIIKTLLFYIICLKVWISDFLSDSFHCSLISEKEKEKFTLLKYR